MERTFCSSALAEYRVLGDETNEAIVLNDLGKLLREQSIYDRAEGYYREALALAEKLKNREHQAGCAGNLGELALDRGRPQEAQVWCEKALPLSQEVGREDMVSDHKQGLARVLEKEGRCVKALPLAEESLRIRERLGQMNIEESGELVARLREKRRE